MRRLGVSVRALMPRGLQQRRRQRDPEALRQLLGAGEELVVVQFLHAVGRVHHMLVREQTEVPAEIDQGPALVGQLEPDLLDVALVLVIVGLEPLDGDIADGRRRVAGEVGQVDDRIAVLVDHDVVEHI